jgi:FlaA1/EpsC-like NDP-sugar epimerase
MKFREKLILAVSDFLMVLLAIELALGLRLDFHWADMLSRYIEPYFREHVAVSALVVLSFFGFGQYERVWRYAGTHELVGLLLATVVGLTMPQLVVLGGEGHLFPRTGLIVAGLLIVFICGGTRLLLRLASEWSGKPITNTRVLIVGANDAGESILRELTRGRKPYVVIGFVDDRAGHSGLRIRGVPVKGKVADLLTLIDAHRVTEVVLAEPNPATVRQVMDLVKGRDIPIRVVPALGDMVDGRVQLSRLRQLSIEDLLEREPVRLAPERIRPLLEGKRVLITGAGGSIGSEIARQVTAYAPEKLMLVGRGENSLYEIGLELPQAQLRVCDVCREQILEAVFAEFRPQVVFHAAAHKHVPLMESAPAEAVYTNVFGTLAVLDCCQRHQVEHFVLLSTDKAVHPANVMGATKALAEKLVAQRGLPGYAAVRFGNVLGSRGSVVPTMQRQIANGGPVTVTDARMTRFFMTIPEAVALVLQASSLAQKGDIYVLDMGKPVRILDLANNLIRLCGYEPGKDIAIQFSGIRPGEKLEEELVSAGENSESTELAKIARVTTPPPGGDWPGPGLEELRRACLAGEQETCRKLLYDLLRAAGTALAVKE